MGLPDWSAISVCIGGAFQMPFNRYALTGLREAHRLKKKELAAAASISRAYLTGLENGDHVNPSTTVVWHLAAVLEVDVRAVDPRRRRQQPWSVWDRVPAASTTVNRFALLGVRSARKFNGSVLAAQSLICSAYVSQLELGGRTNASRSVLTRLAATLSVDVRCLEFDPRVVSAADLR
jgi:transcriptional regulator with XRE-family HTH domain